MCSPVHILVLPEEAHNQHHDAPVDVPLPALYNSTALVNLPNAINAKDVVNYRYLRLPSVPFPGLSISNTMFFCPKKLDAGCAPEDAHEQAMAAAAAAHRETPGGGRRNQEEIETLNRELREAQVTSRS